VNLTITQVDAFTDVAFAGNPAAVCVLSASAGDDGMRNVAREMNLSETAFLYPQADGFNLRWFTPAVEVDLCGHATLASAHVLWTEGHLSVEQDARFYTRSGVLTAVKRGDWMEMNFPTKPCTEASVPPALLQALSVNAVFSGKNQFDYLIEVESEATLRSIQPDFTLLRSLPVRGVIVTSRADSNSGYDFVSRFFAPGSGIDEDPVTGSAHCCLSAYWRDRLNKDEFLAYQASARGGVVKVRYEGDRTFLSGQAVTTLRGELLVPVA
jgi:predicted PhzF superfamily epimerase YddE/YHI9